MKKKKGISIQEEYIRDWNHWRKMYLYGCQDPNWPDGVNLNLVRNHLLNEVRQGAIPPEEMPIPEVVSSSVYGKKRGYFGRNETGV
ncbi:MAG: hypothetical protein Q4A78_07655 [Peptostreptococcaceae bacterium]|nr:hypothetical protein [Peptostreptococcaceae bacterium]